MRRGFPARIGALSAALALAACGGSGGSSASTTAPSAAPVVEEDQVVIQVDVDKDGDLDILTLDPSQDPFVIVEALEGDGAGGFVDRTQTSAPATLDPGLSNGLAAHRETSLEKGTLLIIDSSGDEVLVEILD